jgi:hypothetical protein
MRGTFNYSLGDIGVLLERESSRKFTAGCERPLRGGEFEFVNDRQWPDAFGFASLKRSLDGAVRDPFHWDVIAAAGCFLGARRGGPAVH